jgi:alpha-L-rhamnosidase
MNSFRPLLFWRRLSMDRREHRRHQEHGPGYKHIIACVIDGRLNSVLMSYDSIRGQIEVKLTHAVGRMMSLDVNILANTSTAVHVPLSGGQVLLEGRCPVAAAEGVKVLRTEADRVVVEVGSGHCGFTPAAK